jgi:DnaJ-class molecular chaperone
LGIEPDATQTQIKSAYRKAMSEYHPDKVAHLGADLKELAARRTVEINEAYSKLRTG